MRRKVAKKLFCRNGQMADICPTLVHQRDIEKEIDKERGKKGTVTLAYEQLLKCTLSKHPGCKDRLPIKQFSGMFCLAIKLNVR